MATVKWHLDELTGETLTLRLYPLGSGTIANTGGDAMTESGDGLFSATVGETLTGWHKTYADRSSVPVATGFVNMSDASPVVVETPAAQSVTQVVYTSTEADDTGGANITWFTNETAKTKTVICLNAAGDPIDLDTDYDLTDAYLVIERPGPQRTDVQVIEIDAITIGGTDDNELTFQADATVLAKKGDFIWAFRQADKSVIASGRITVIYAADVDP